LTSLRANAPSFPVWAPFVALFRKTLTLATGRLLSDDNILPEIEYCAKSLTGNNKQKKLTKTIKVFGIKVYLGVADSACIIKFKKKRM
jgi:hypothetical protein